jgi:hypothetical protein
MMGTYVSKRSPASGIWSLGSGWDCCTERAYGVPAYYTMNVVVNKEGTQTTLPISGRSMLLQDPSAIRQAYLLLMLVAGG